MGLFSIEKRPFQKEPSNFDRGKSSLKLQVMSAKESYREA